MTVGICSASRATDREHQDMMSKILIRGMFAGFVAAVLAFVVAKLLGESQVGLAIAFETASHAGEHHHDEAEIVSRTIQSTAGLATGLLLFGIAIGGMFALAYACVQGRLGKLGARETAALVALGGFVGAFLIPFLKYPANPPAIGNPDTIGERTVLYFSMVVISLLVLIGSARAGRQLVPKFGGWNAALIAAGGGLVVIAIAYLVLPTVSEVPDGFPANVVWRFRIASVGIQATMWTTIGLVFGALTERSLRSAPRAAPNELTAQQNILAGH